MRAWTSVIALCASACGAPHPAATDGDPFADERALAASATEHQPRWLNGELRLGDGYVGETGLRLPTAGSGSVGVSLARWGRSEMLAAAEGGVTVDGAEVRIARGASVTEWWRSLPSGLEQGVTIEERPEGDGDLVLRMRVQGLRATDDAHGGVVLRDRVTGEARARYAHLYVADADGHAIDAVLIAAGEHIDIRVRDREARYPIVVDPLLFAVQEATLRSGTPAEFASFGLGVAMNDSGDLVAVAQGNSSTIELFGRVGTMWSPTASVLAPGTIRTEAVAMAFSDSGDRLLVGTPLGPSVPGGGRVFSRSSGTWVEEAFLTDGSACNGHAIGRSVALDGSGSLAVLGATAACFPNPPLSGEAFVFRRTGASWTQEAVLTPPDPTDREGFGAASAVSGDASRILVGAPTADSGGLVRIFVFDGSSWSLEATLNGASGAYFGARVALDDTGTRALVASPSVTVAAASGAGRVHVILRTGSTWAEEAVLEAEVPTMFAAFGTGLVLSNDGSRALVSVSGTSSPGSVTMFVRTGTTWARAGRFSPSDVEASDGFGAAIAGTAAIDRAVVGVPSDDEPDGSGSARVLVLQDAHAQGEPCGASVECVSNFCVDGVCCEIACGAGATDCQACSAALTGGADGSCLPLSPTVAPTVTCRAANGGCDSAESCVAGQATCPVDGYQAMGTVCRAAATDMACDAVETCSGSSPACPTDGVAISGTACRATTGACDPTESCDGSSRVCPADVVLPAGTECGGALPRSCTTAGVCDGASGECGGGIPLAEGTPCFPRDAANPCDVDDVCTAESTCPDRWAPAATTCGTAGGGGSCDAPDHCSGMTGACIDAFLVDVECRGSTGPCDPGERCSGDAPTCPTDEVSPAGLVCRTSSDPSCNPEETCDGTSGACAADIDRCVPPDAPRDAGSADDAGSPSAATGCACRATAGGSPNGGALVSLLAALALGGRASRRRGRSVRAER
jgi:hypothetical protein